MDLDHISAYYIVLRYANEQIFNGNDSGKSGASLVIWQELPGTNAYGNLIAISVAIRFPFFWKKVLTNEWVNDIINEFCSREQQQNKFLKKLKKVVDIEKNLWYDIKVACDGVEKERKNFLKKVKKVLDKVKTTW